MSFLRAQRDGDAIYQYRCFSKTNKKTGDEEIFFSLQNYETILALSIVVFCQFFSSFLWICFLLKLKIMPYYAIDVLRSMLRTRNLFWGCVIGTKMSCDNRNRIKTKIRNKNRFCFEWLQKFNFKLILKNLKANNVNCD